MTHLLTEQEVIVSQIESIKKQAMGLTISGSGGLSRDLYKVSSMLEKLRNFVLGIWRQQRVLEAMKHVETLMNSGADLESISIDGIHFAIRDGKIVHKEHPPFEDDDMPF
jgi:hypothetical protein